MLSKKLLIPILFLISCSKVESASLIESSYEYVMNLGKNVAPRLMSILDCIGEPEVWACARMKAGKMLDGWDEDVQKERRSWQEAADAEVRSTGRSFEEMPSKIGEDVEKTLGSLVEIVDHAMARAFTSSKKHDSGGIDTITISAGSGDKKKIKKKTKPPKIHLVHPMLVPMRKAQKEEKGRSFPDGRQTWVIGDRIESNHDVANAEKLNVERISEENVLPSVRKGRSSIETSHDVANVEKKDVEGSSGEIVPAVRKGRGSREGRGVMSDLWKMGEKALDVMAEHALESENKDNGVEDKSSFPEQRGKKKKKKKAILKLLILGAVLKAKIGTLLQILSFKLQVKFFIVAVLGLAINLARLWIDLKNKHNHQPQKVIYYEHAQHQHHYDHEEEHGEGGWGPWSRSMEPEEQTEVDVDVEYQNSPYRAHYAPAQERIQHQPYYRPPGRAQIYNV